MRSARDLARAKFDRDFPKHFDGLCQYYMDEAGVPKAIRKRCWVAVNEMVISKLWRFGIGKRLNDVDIDAMVEVSVYKWLRFKRLGRLRGLARARSLIMRQVERAANA